MTYIGRLLPHLRVHCTWISCRCTRKLLQARSQRGKWLVRIEDLDRQEVKGAADLILRTLEAYHLDWDDGLSKSSCHLSSTIG